MKRFRRIEWPTLLLIFGIYALFLGLTWFHRALPLWLFLPAAAWCAAWWGSAQHEILHGHPTRWRGLNHALAMPPIWLWLPFPRYREAHLRHHRDARLTDPLDDPESRYLTAQSWEALGWIGQKLVLAQGTLLGRLIIGPLWCAGQFWLDEISRLRRKERGAWRIAIEHVVLVGLLLGWAIGLCGMPLWQYLVGFCYGGTALALIRSFAEHRAEETIEKRTAIVEKSPIFALLFLNNNLHAVHHKHPSMPWYQIPRFYAKHRAAILAQNGGLVYAGYREVFRRFWLKMHDSPVHPLGRAPMGSETEAQPRPAGRKAKKSPKHWLDKAA